MQAELTHHLGYEKHHPAGRGSGNSRNGASTKTLKGDFGEAVIEVPRDRNGTFEPKVVPPHDRRFAGFDDKILSLSARGMTTRSIQGHLLEIYGAEGSPSLISEVTDAVIEEVKARQTRPLEALYPILFLDALMVKMRPEGRVENRAVYVAIGTGARQVAEDAGGVSQRRRGTEGDVSGIAQRDRQMGTAAALEGGAEPVHVDVARNSGIGNGKRRSRRPLSRQNGAVRFQLRSRLISTDSPKHAFAGTCPR
jgi:hypothetical protein